jgi:type IV pilus assembly protein PilC
MPSFVYQARDASGARVSGAREASSQQDAMAALRESGLFITKLVPAESKEARALFPEGLPAAPSTPPPTNLPAANGAAVEAGLPARKWELKNENAPAQHAVALPSKSIVSPQGNGFDPLRTPPLPRRNSSAAASEKARVESARIESAQSQAASTPVAQPVPAFATDAFAPLPPRYHLRSNAKDLSLFWSQMHSMLHAGVALSHAMTMMAKNAPNAALRAACEEIAPRIAAGTPLSELMIAYPGIFSPLMMGMIRAGEAGGFLDRMCKRLSEYSERDYHIAQLIKRETWYPKMLLCMCLLIPTIVPAAIAYFRDNQSFLGAWIRAAWPAILILTGLALAVRFKNFLAPLTKHLKPFQLLLDQIKLLIPIGGKSTRGLATAKFCRALGALQAAGMGVRQTINLSADACGNSVIEQSARGAISRLESGATMTEALEGTRQFPPIAIQMLRTGEATGNFEEQLDKVADFLESDAETTIKQAVVVLGIVAFLVMAIYIAINVIQMYVGTYSNLIDEGIDLQN